MFTLANFSQPVSTNNNSSAVKAAQETIYHFLYDCLLSHSPEAAIGHTPQENSKSSLAPQAAIAAFKSLFIYPNPQTNKKALQALHQILLANNEADFRLILKRSFFLIINHANSHSQEQAIEELFACFSTNLLQKKTSFPAIYQLRTWLKRFTKSREYQEIKLFTLKSDTSNQGNWIQRYTYYLLVAQYLDVTNPLEQRKAARFKAQRLKEQFKFNLAMYTARCQSPGNLKQKNIHPNPTLLEDEFLQIIKLILIRKGKFSHENLASIFIQQIKQQTFSKFKQIFLTYLTSAIEKPELTQQIKPILAAKFASISEERDRENLNKSLLLQTCKETIDYLLMEDRERPSQLFILLLSQADPIILVRLLSKIILICPAAQTHLELRIANLLNYYEKFSEVECQWVINFLEVLNIALALYTDNVKYELIKINPDTTETAVIDLNAYRVFSYYKRS